MKIYLVNYQYNSPTVISGEVEKETEKSYMIDRNSIVMEVGTYGYMGKRISKDNSNVFLSVKDALEHIMCLAYLKKGKLLEQIIMIDQIISDLER